MTKRKASAANIAFTAYIATNLIALVPNLLVSLLVNKLISDPSTYIIVRSIIALPIIFYSIKFSINNINRSFIIESKEKIIRYFLIYLIFINFIAEFLLYIRVNYFSVEIFTILIYVVEASLVFISFAPKWIVVSPIEEINGVGSKPQEVSILKSIIITAGLTFLGGFLFLIFPFMIYFMIIDYVGYFVWPILVLYLLLIIIGFRKLATTVN